MKSNNIVIANWKMRFGLEESENLLKKMKTKFNKSSLETVVICPGYLSLNEGRAILKSSGIKLGAQNVFWEDRGAYTGEVSPDHLREAGCEYVIIGHSERRKYLLENYEMIHQKLKAVLNIKGLVPVVCIGEEAVERKTEKRDFVLANQIQQSLGGINVFKNQQIVIAYEPIWAIGSGVAIEPEEALYAHKIIRLNLNNLFGMKVVNNNFKIIYGGSIDSENAKKFVNLENIDGVLVGTASTDVEEFYKISKIFLS
jgi:triosephosphate isomerase